MKTILLAFLVLMAACAPVTLQRPVEIKKKLVIYQKELYSLREVNEEINLDSIYAPYIVSAPARDALIFACRPMQLMSALNGQEFYLYYIVEEGSKRALATQEAYDLIFKVWNYLQIGRRRIFIACHISPPQFFALDFRFREF